jgi:hypothetical protein
MAELAAHNAGQNHDEISGCHRRSPRRLHPVGKVRALWFGWLGEWCDQRQGRGASPMDVGQIRQDMPPTFAHFAGL